MELHRVKDLHSLSSSPKALEEAVWSFVQDSHSLESGADGVGLFNQTIESIANYTIFNHDDSRQLWVAEDGEKVLAYVMAHISKDVDNKLCFWLTQAWVHPSIRRTPQVKEWFQMLRAEAKRCLCAHIIAPSSRGVEAYCRFLGKGWHPYVTLLKEDI